MTAGLPGLFTILGVALIPWGFFGHKLINRMAVFTLPPELITLYKTNIDYIEAHAVDADKRRYASKFEAVRHYIDLEYWDEDPTISLPLKWNDALLSNTHVRCIQTNGDTLMFRADSSRDLESCARLVRDRFFAENRSVGVDTLERLYGGKIDCHRAELVEPFSEHGMLPYNLLRVHHQLVRAFEAGNSSRVLKLSADLGHYIGDAHVPLHTTRNYNGQLTDQVGLHAFWETRIPELFADSYDFVVGQAEYIADPATFYWNMVLASHALVDSVLSLERQIASHHPADAQYCFDSRPGGLVHIQCEDFAKAYSDAMDDMVERRMRTAVHAIGCAWYTAWVDAGSPQIHGQVIVPDSMAQSNLERAYRTSGIKGREHSWD